MRLRGKFSTISRVGGFSLTLALTLTCFSACAEPHVPSRIVYEDPTNFVRVEADHRVLADRPETRHTHPATVDADTMAVILKGVHVREHRLRVHIWMSGEAEREPAFTDEEIELLASKLSDALGKATPQERVTYYLSYPQTSVKRQITSGGLYVQHRELHFTLSNHRDIYGIPAYGMVYDRRYPVLPIVPKGFDVLFEPVTALVPKQFSVWDAVWGLEQDDIVIDLNKLYSPKSVALLP